MSKLVAIYELLDPGTLEKRYVGKSINVKQRFAQHKNVRGIKPSCHADYWRLSLSNRGVWPILQIIEIVAEEVWEEREKFWIKTLREEGHPLTNTDPGGKGPAGGARKERWISPFKGTTLSPEHRDRMSQGLIRAWEQRKAYGVVIRPVWLHTPEVRAKQAKTVERQIFERGGEIIPRWPHTRESRELMSRKAKERAANESDEQKKRRIEKISKTLLARKSQGYISPMIGYKHTPEDRAKMSAAKKGKPWTEKRRVAFELAIEKRKEAKLLKTGNSLV